MKLARLRPGRRLSALLAAGLLLSQSVDARAAADGAATPRAAIATDASPASETAMPASSPTPAELRRTPDQTFLTFPEWFLVHSPAEYADYLASGAPPSRFPLFAHVVQFWQSYRAVARELERYPFNGGYHLMVMVIGTSTTVEYGLKGLYEHTVGRVAEAFSAAAEPLPEERFAAEFARSYVDFIRVDPWYRYDFGAQLERLWRDVPFGADGAIRRIERRYALTTELLVKAVYAKLIGFGTAAVYEEAKPTTAVVLSQAPESDRDYPEWHALEPARDPARPVLGTLPRYEAFTRYAGWVAAQGLDFVEIAGNDGEILVSALAPAAWRAEGVRVLFEQPILTRPGWRRVVFALPVNALARWLRGVRAGGDAVVVEHVYDY